MNERIAWTVEIDDGDYHRMKFHDQDAEDVIVLANKCHKEGYDIHIIPEKGE